MKEKTPLPQKPNTLKVSLDGKTISVPDWITASVAAIQSYLEGMATEKERVLWSMQIDGVTVSLSKSLGGMQSFNTVKATSITFGELGRQLISAGSAKLTELRNAIEECIPLVLINDRSWARKVWRDWQPQLREPLFSLRALQELKQPELLAILNSTLLSKHLDKVTSISSEIDVLMAGRGKEGDPHDDIIGFTDLVEGKLLPWLDQLQGYFGQLNEKART